MREAEYRDWQRANQRYLMTALGSVRGALERFAADREPRALDVDRDAAALRDAAGHRDAIAHPEAVARRKSAVAAGHREAASLLDAARHREAAVLQDATIRELAAVMPAPPALDVLCDTFDLSPFERQVLLLCAGVELEGGFASLCSQAHGDSQLAYPTFSLALAALPQPEWGALAPAAPLRHWRLIEVGPGPALTLSPLRIDERILHYLAGVQYVDERLIGMVEPLREVDELVPSYHDVAEKMATAWAQAGESAEQPVLQLCGDEISGKRAIAAEVASLLGLDMTVMAAHALPTAPAELDGLARLWQREAALRASLLMLECDEIQSTDAHRHATVNQFVERTDGWLLVSSRERRRWPRRSVLTFEIGKPTTAEQRAIWREALGEAGSGLNGQVEGLAYQFNLSAPAIRAVCAGARSALVGGRTPEAVGAALWDTCRLQARPQLDDLAQRIVPSAAWEDLVLPPAQREMLKEVAIQVRHRATVYERWGFASKGSRGLGISALFAGSSGTGKTMAAEVLAETLNLDLYRIDLSAVVSKYIGETEKNLRRVFDAAEGGGIILLFDEADALFGKRSEVKDSHDRHANIEVSYLLQRMEAYRGLSILTTNLRDALDPAFMRRLRFIVHFPFPDEIERAEIWKRIFPRDTPTWGIDVLQLARLNVAGGSIRNIAMNAAFRAVESGEPVTMTHVLQAARSEYAKLERPLTETEIGGVA